ncbi:hypothetical protein N338_04647, partial [Podiceps cristatus]
AGSARVDVATAVDIMLTDQTVRVADSVLSGPLGYGLSALLLGRSSTTRQGIFVLPGIIDADYTGVIKIMVYTLLPPVSIPASSKIAQLVPFNACVPKTEKRQRGDKGFGSTGVPTILFTTELKKGKPEATVKLANPFQESIVLRMILDNGANVTIV